MNPTPLDLIKITALFAGKIALDRYLTGKRKIFPGYSFTSAKAQNFNKKYGRLYAESYMWAVRHSYSELARFIDHPKAVRAVGGAVDVTGLALLFLAIVF